MNSVGWAAGLYIGEGSTGVARRKSGQHTRIYMCMQIGMLDTRAMHRFAETLGLENQLRIETYRLDPSRRLAKINVTHLIAAQALNTLLPHMEGTDKGDQTNAAFERCGWTKHNGVWLRPADAYRGVPGNKNAKGKTWTLSPETRRRQMEARHRREALR